MKRNLKKKLYAPNVLTTKHEKYAADPDADAQTNCHNSNFRSKFVPFVIINSNEHYSPIEKISIKLEYKMI